MLALPLQSTPLTLQRERIGLVVRGGVKPATWSGTPAGVLRGLEEDGYEGVVCDAEIPRQAYRLLRVYLRVVGQPEDGSPFSPTARRARELTARWRRRRLPSVNGWIVLGSENGLPVNEPFVTLDDLTVADAKHHAWYFGPVAQPYWERWQANQAQIYRRATRCFAATSWARDSICRDYAVPPDKVEVVGLGRNLELRPPSSRDWSAPRFLFVGTDWKRKNGAAVIGAFANIRRRFPSAELSVVGDHPPVEMPGVREYGRLEVARPEDREVLARLFSESTCLVLPSLFEPFGIVYAEAAAAGLAIVGTTAGGAPEVIGPAGLCVDPNDPHAIEAAMTRLADPDVAMAYGNAGPAHAAQYTWTSVASRMAQALPGARDS